MKGDVMEAIEKADALWDEYDNLREQEILLHRMVEKKKHQAEAAEELVREKLREARRKWSEDDEGLLIKSGHEILEWQKNQI